MVAITKRRARLVSLQQFNWSAVVLSVGLALAVFMLGRQANWWPLALVVVAGVELWWNRRRVNSKSADSAMILTIPLVVGMSAVLIVAVNIRFVSQAVAAVAYGLWYWWWTHRRNDSLQLAHLLISQVVLFEALFLVAAVWRTPEWMIMALGWLGGYLPVQAVLRAKGERAAAVLASAWGLIVAEVSWVLLLWLFTYATPGGYVLVPQPALVLGALAYCFGSIYASARSGSLSRSRLVEYLAIGLILIVMVIAGTSWRGSI